MHHEPQSINTNMIQVKMATGCSQVSLVMSCGYTANKANSDFVTPC